MDIILEEFGQALLSLVAGGFVVALFLWVLEIATAF